jgi:hypothetical protein
MMRASLLLPVLVVLLSSAGCTGTVGNGGGGETGSTLEALAASATRLDFTTSTSIPQNPAPPVNVTVTDAAAVQALFDATLALSPVVPGDYNCPFAAGVDYHLTFTSGSASAVIDFTPDGCEWVTLPDGSTRGASAAYWSLLATTLGIPEATIYPYAPPSGP